MPVGGKPSAFRSGRSVAVRAGALLLAGTLVGGVLAAAGAIAVLIGPMPAHAAPAPARAAASPAGPAHAAPAPRVGTAASTDWTLAEAKDAVRSAVISRVPNAPAQVDTDTVTAALDGTNIRVVMLPFAPLDDEGREAAGSRGVDLRHWATDQDIELIQVQGLQVTASIYDISPSTMAELEPVLAHQNVTSQVMYAIAMLTDAPDPPEDTAAPPRAPADPARVQTIADALERDRIYNDPQLADPQQISEWDTGGGPTVRAAFLPPVPLGETVTDLVTPLHERFPDDIVVVARGRWLDVAGPDQQMAYSSLLWTFGYYSRGVLGWEVEPTALVRLLTERVALLRTGVVTDQPAPDDPRDPVSSVSGALPWIFGGVALAIVVTVTLVKAFGGSARAVQHRASTRERRDLGARLAVIAGQVVAIEPLAQREPARADLSVALERYRVARDVLASDGSVPVAREAIEEAERRLRDVSEAVGVPLAVPAGSVGDGAAQPAGDGDARQAGDGDARQAGDGDARQARE